MKKLKYLFCIILFCLLSIQVRGQKKINEPFEFYRVPADMAIILLANRDKSPVKIESATLFTNEGGNTIICAYNFRNVGDKPVRAVEVTVITNTLFHPTPRTGRMAMYSDIVGFEGDKNAPLKPMAPGELRSFREELEKKKFLADEIVVQIRNLPSQIKAKFVVALVITKIEFPGGQVLDLQSDADDLYKLFDEGTETR